MMLMPTLFAPAERNTKEEIDRIVDHFKKIAHLMPFMNSVPDVVLVLNHNRQTVFANSLLQEILGISLRDAYGQRPGEMLRCVHAENNTGGCGTGEACQTCGAVKAILVSLNGKQSVQECQILRNDGEALDLRVWATPFELDGEAYSIFAIKDISDEKRRRNLERIFFHDVMNIVGMIYGTAEFYMENGHEGAEELDTILYHQTIRLIDEINAQRDLLAAENGELQVRPESLNTLGMLRETCEAYRRHKLAEKRQLVITEESVDVSFRSDYTLLMRVLGNMVKNALEASQEGETVTLACYPDGEAVVFEVHNPAVMPPYVQHQIFHRSFSTKGKERGLGTYSMKLLSERYLGGQVSFSSRAGQGTVFRAVYPL